MNYTMNIPEIIKYTLIRFVELVWWMSKALAIGAIVALFVTYSHDVLGNPFYGIGLTIFIFMIYISYKVAKLDIKDKEYQRDKILDLLKKE